MKITILGSGGGEGYPATFCGCDHCNTARRVGGKSIRTLSQTLINDDLLIDYPHDSADHARRFGLNLGNVESLLVTHGHSDHFYPCEFFLRGGCYAHELKYPEFNIYGSAPVKRIFDSVAEAYNAHAGILDTIKVNEFSAYETKRVGRYTVTALPAKHATHLSPLNYIIECDGKTLIYFHDTGFPNIEVLDVIKGKEKLVLPFERISAVSVLGRNKINIYYEEKLYQLKSDEHFNALKYVNIYYRYKNTLGGENDEQFLGL
jgi:phosphoribosyl 1,2-cyclic phosphate phosphodiesterase